MLDMSPDKLILKPAFSKIVCEPGWRWVRREKPMSNFDLFYIWSGEGKIEVNGAYHDVGPGSCFLFRPGDFTSATHNAENPLVLTYIHFSTEELVEVIPKRYRLLTETEEFEFLLSRYVQLYLMQTHAATKEAKLLLKQIMIYLLRTDFKAPVATKANQQITEVIHEVANFIRQNPSEAHRVEDLAMRANLSPRYFSMKFREVLGTSVQTYMIHTRIKRAEYLLTYAGMNVTEVAEALGYRDIFFFSRQFKQYTGKNPSEIR